MINPIRSLHPLSRGFIILTILGLLIVPSKHTWAETINFTPEGPLTVIESVAPLGSPLTYVSGGTGLTGFAECWPSGPGCGPLGVNVSPSFAGNSIDHYWVQGGYESATMIFTSATPLNRVFGIIGADHAPHPQENLEYRIFGASGTGVTEEGTILSVYRDAFDTANTTVGHSDDYATLWGFNGSYTEFYVVTGDHLNPAFNSEDFELDGLAAYRAVPPESVVPEPATVLLLGSGLLGLGWWRHRASR